ncbi:MAG: hypothetical protein M5U12_31555 [Verrucomicrobia bacterium]|nr:hypothetical protein [Verrucomicrobiota bacterium]
MRQGFFQHRTAPLLQGVDDPRLRVDAEAEYKNAHQLLRQFRAQGATPKAMEPARLSLFVASVALLTYGQLHVIPDILDNLPPVRHPARLLARSVSALLPSPRTPTCSHDLPSSSRGSKQTVPPSSGARPWAGSACSQPPDTRPAHERTRNAPPSRNPCQGRSTPDA